jgi:hypothetical protein
MDHVPQHSFPSAGPTTICEATPSSHAAKPHPTQMGDEYLTGDASSPPQMGQYPNLGTSTNHTILLTSEEEFLLQTHSCQYSAPPDSAPTTLETTPATTGPPLMIPRPNTKPPLCIPHIPLRRNVNNPQDRVAHNYNLVDDLAQSLAAMSILEVLKTYPTQRKSLLSALGTVEPVDTRLITFDLDGGESRLLSLVAFQIPIKI